MTARRHHYLSQCYLRGFAKPYRSDNSLLQVFDLVRNKRFETSPRNVAVERDFNRVDVDGQEPDWLESELSHFESELNSTLVALDNGALLTDGEHFSNVITFATLISSRNPRFRETMRDFTERSATVALQLMTHTREVWESQVKQAKLRGANLVSYEEIKVAVSALSKGEYELVVPPADHTQREMDSFERFANLLAERNWSLWRTTPQDSGGFITSDHPFCLFWNKASDLPPGLGHRGTMVVMPLSRHVCITGSFEDAAEVGVANAARVAFVNAVVADYAETQVYASDDKFALLHDLEQPPVYGRDLLEYVKARRAADDSDE